MTVSQWADKYRYLSPEGSAEPGRWRTLAFQREPLDSISDPRVRRTVIKACTQIIKTEAILNGVAYFAHQDPGPILILQPGDTDAKDFSKERIAPMIRDTPVLRTLFADSKAKDSDSTITEKLFTGGLLAIAGAGSARNVARRAIRILAADEVDKYKPTAEGSSLLLARKRLATFRHRAKEIYTCSPTVAGSEIDKAYDESDRREYYVPCGKCGAFQTLMGKFHSNVHWDSDLPTREEQARSAYYQCANCGDKWYDAARMTAVDKGEWRANAPFEGVAGFWISELYSPWKRMEEVVLSFLMQKDSGDLQPFVNTSLAENWSEKGEAPEWEHLVNRPFEYDAGTAPRGVLFITAGVDVQRDRIEVTRIGWGRGRESWDIDHTIFMGRISEPKVQEDLTAFLASTVPHESGAAIPVGRVFIDSGDGTTTNDVYGYVRQLAPDRFVAIKGDDRGAIPVGQPSPVDVTAGGHKYKGGLKIKSVKVSFFKSELYSFLKLRPPTDEERESGLSFPPGYCHFPKGKNYGDEHYKQLCSERLVTRKQKNGRAKQEWMQDRPRNEALDCRIYARAAAWDYGLDQAQEAHWQALEAQLVAMNRPRPPIVDKQQNRTPAHGVRFRMEV